MTNKKYSCRIFLRDASHHKRLVPGSNLYGSIIESTKTIFMSPYPPPDNCQPLIGVVNNAKGITPQNPQLINLSVKDDSITAWRFINKRFVQLPVEVVYSAASYERTPFNQLEMDMLWNQRVLIFGMGTGGSKIALELARAGVRHLTLCDFDRLDFANISRHEGDMHDVGKPKVQVSAERIYRINPAIKVKTYFEDIFERSFEQVKEIFKQADLVIAATDNTAVQLLINELTHNLQIPCVFGGCYEEALGGEVFFTLPGEDMPCMACLRGGIKQPKRKNKIDYSTARGPEDYQGQPGLHAAVDFVTCIEIQICLGILLQKSPTSKLAQMIDPKCNYLLIGGMLSEGFYKFRKPFDIFYQPLSKPRKTCVVCQNYNLETEIEEEK